MDRVGLLRALKGPALSVVMALFLFGAAGRRDLVVRTGWNKDAVGDALLVLENMGIVARVNYRRWALLNGFPFELSTGFEQADCEKPSVRRSESERLDPSLSGSLVVSRSNYLDNEILAVCHECGIYGQKARDIASMSHVVELGVDYVRAHVAAVLADGRDVALAIWRIERGWKVSTVCDDAAAYAARLRERGVIE